jgi:hypothetical protein
LLGRGSPIARRNHVPKAWPILSSSSADGRTAKMTEKKSSGRGHVIERGEKRPVPIAAAMKVTNRSCSAP